MKPIKLEIEGLNSFENKQIIDFEKIGKGVFGIFGKTGSGKSTILDAITLALYGEVERSKQNIDFINTKKKRTVVSLEFEIFITGENKRFVVSRSFSIKKNGKDVESSASLFEVFNDDKQLIVEGAIKVNEKVLEIIGLGRNEFVKCIALPQGEFSAFLKAKQSERTEIMSNIFDLSSYGEELCAKVKEKVNEFDKRVTALSESLSLVEYASDEELEKAKEKYFSNNESYNKEKSNLNEKTDLYSKMSASLERKKKLDDVNAQFSELSAQQKDISALEVEVAKNQSANLIKSDYEKLQKTEIDERELSQKIANLSENQQKTQLEMAETQKEFEIFKKSYDDKLIELNTRLAKINELMKFEQEENQLRSEQEKINEQIQSEQSHLEIEQEKLNYIVSNLVRIEEEIEKIDDFIEANKSDVDLSYALEQTKGIESEIILIDEFVKSLESVFDRTNEELAIAQAEYDSCIRQEKKLTEKIDQIQNSINVAFEDVDKTNFNKIRSCDKQLEGMKEVKIKQAMLEEILSKLIFDKENRQASVASLNEQIEKEQGKLNEIEIIISDRERFIANERERREELLGGNFFSLVSNQMKIGDDCPICGSKVITKSYEETIDINPITNGILGEEENLRALRLERDKTIAEIVALKEKRTFEKTQIESNKAEIDSISLKKSALYSEFVEEGEHSKESFEKLFSLLSDTVDNLEKLIELQDMLREEELSIIIRKSQSGAKISIYNSYIESLNDILYSQQKKKAEREIAILNVNEKYTNLKEYKKQIAEGKNIELLIDSKKEEKYKLKDNQTKLLVEKSNLEKNIAEINSEIAVLNEKLLNSKNLSIQTREKITENGIPEGISVSEEEKKICTEIDDLKNEYRKKDIQLESCKELLSRTQNDFNVTHSILSSKKEEIEKLQKSINEAMATGKFESNEELELHFVSQSEIKEKQAKINIFNTKMNLLFMQKKELELESYENVTGEKVQQLKLDLDMLSGRVQQLSEMVGRYGAEYEKLEADNKKMKEISSELSSFKHKLDLAKELASVLKGKALAEYVAEEYLQEITEVANQKLNLLLDGKYILNFKNKEFIVIDNFNDGLIRSAGTLSGGETFLVSLSLAFAISDSISLLSSRNMEFFFLDEGFGTLDKELCETVVSALHKLESQNLNIGLISHVTELEESIKNKIYVTRSETGSKISIEHSL